MPVSTPRTHIHRLLINHKRTQVPSKKTSEISYKMINLDIKIKGSRGQSHEDSGRERRPVQIQVGKWFRKGSQLQRGRGHSSGGSWGKQFSQTTHSFLHLILTDQILLEEKKIKEMPPFSWSHRMTRERQGDWDSRLRPEVILPG